MPFAMTRLIYRILPAAEWAKAEAAGAFRGTAHDSRDGFIHFSTAQQMAETAAKHYAGQHGLLLLAVDADALGPALKWERSRNDDLFPHLYGDLPVAAVRRIDPLPLGADGRHVFPEPVS